MIEKAIRREDGAQKFYLERADKLKSENERQIFLKLAEEEGKHMILLENILEFLLKSKNSVASAEF